MKLKLDPPETDELVGEYRISSSLELVSVVVPCWRRAGGKGIACDGDRLRADERAVVIVKMVGRERAPGAARERTTGHHDGSERNCWG